MSKAFDLVRDGDLDALQDIVDKTPDQYLSKMRDRTGYSLLTFAITSRRERVVRFLLKHGASPNE